MKPVPSVPGYFASEKGHIWSKGHKLYEWPNQKGYMRVNIYPNGQGTRAKMQYTHRLVCEAYHGPCPPKMECRHLNGKRDDNRPENLAWGDKATNEADKIAHGTLLRGERVGGAKLTAALVIEARRRAKLGERVNDIAVSMGVGRAALTDAVMGRRWKHLPGALPKFYTRRMNPNRPFKRDAAEALSRK